MTNDKNAPTTNAEFALFCKLKSHLVKRMIEECDKLPLKESTHHLTTFTNMSKNAQTYADADAMRDYLQKIELRVFITD